MKITDFRIGNRFLFKVDSNDPEFEWVESEVISVDAQTGMINGLYFEENIKPIPLTEDWLLKFDFHRIDLTENGSGRAPYWIRWCSDFVLEEYHGESTFAKPEDYNFYWSVGKYTVGLYSVHQIQNLYFALTGEELTINPK